MGWPYVDLMMWFYMLRKKTQKNTGGRSDTSLELDLLS
jgi:hypothetical protein